MIHLFLGDVSVLLFSATLTALCGLQVLSMLSPSIVCIFFIIHQEGQCAHGVLHMSLLEINNTSCVFSLENNGFFLLHQLFQLPWPRDGLCLCTGQRCHPEK